MTAHTPGPWVVEDDGEGFNVVHHFKDYRGNPADQRIVACYGETPAEEVANARLCAAAPELLEALRDALAEASRDGPWPVGTIHTDITTPQWVRGARAAIARATGAQA